MRKRREKLKAWQESKKTTSDQTHTAAPATNGSIALASTTTTVSSSSSAQISPSAKAAVTTTCVSVASSTSTSISIAEERREKLKAWQESRKVAQMGTTVAVSAGTTAAADNHTKPVSQESSSIMEMMTVSSTHISTEDPNISSGSTINSSLGSISTTSTTTSTATISNLPMKPMNIQVNQSVSSSSSILPTKKRFGRLKASKWDEDVTISAANSSTSILSSSSSVASLPSISLSSSLRNTTNTDTTTSTSSITITTNTNSSSSSSSSKSIVEDDPLEAFMSSLYEAGDVTTQKELKFNSTTSSTSNNDLFSNVNSSNNHDDASKDANNNVVMSSNNKNDDDGYDYSNKIITMEQILAGTQFLDSKYDNRNDNNNNSNVINNSNNNRNDDTTKDDDMDNTSRTYNKYFNNNDDNDEPKDYPNNITFPSSTSSSPNYPDHLYAHISKIHRGWESDAQSPMRDDEDRDNNNRDSQFDDNRNDNDNSDNNNNNNNNNNNSTTNKSDKSIDKNKNRSSNNNNSSSSSRVKNRREETEEERELREEREKKEFIDALRKAREEEDRIRERILKIDVVTPLTSSSSSSSSSSKLGRVFAGEGDMIEEYELEKKKRSALEILEEAKRGKLLREVDHSKIQYAPFRKNLYIVPRALNKLSEAEVIEKREDIQLKVRGRGCPSPVDNWEQCGLSDRILQTIHSLQLKEPFAIQRQAIPAIMCGRDVIGVAKTGSGKTLAFLLPMLRHILDQPPLLDGEGPIGLVMAPARELAFQIYNEAKKFTKPLGLRVTAIYGK